MCCTLISVAVFQAFSKAQALHLVISALEFSDRRLYALEESLANWGLYVNRIALRQRYKSAIKIKIGSGV
jgi:hypothetical protein